MAGQRLYVSLLISNVKAAEMKYQKKIHTEIITLLLYTLLLTGSLSLRAGQTIAKNLRQKSAQLFCLFTLQRYFRSKANCLLSPANQMSGVGRARSYCS